MTRYTRIGLTGANGTIGRVLLAGLGGRIRIQGIYAPPGRFSRHYRQFRPRCRSRRGL